MISILARPNSVDIAMFTAHNIWLGEARISSQKAGTKQGLVIIATFPQLPIDNLYAE